MHHNNRKHGLNHLKFLWDNFFSLWKAKSLCWSLNFSRMLAVRSRNFDNSMPNNCYKEHAFIQVYRKICSIIWIWKNCFNDRTVVFLSSFVLLFTKILISKVIFLFMHFQCTVHTLSTWYTWQFRCFLHKWFGSFITLKIFLN